jgi:hypothetical protein
MALKGYTTAERETVANQALAALGRPGVYDLAGVGATNRIQGSDLVATFIRLRFDSIVNAVAHSGRWAHQRYVAELTEDPPNTNFALPFFRKKFLTPTELQPLHRLDFIMVEGDLDPLYPWMVGYDAIWTPEQDFSGKKVVVHAWRPRGVDTWPADFRSLVVTQLAGHLALSVYREAGRAALMFARAQRLMQTVAAAHAQMQRLPRNVTVLGDG